jgi:hypothetical protein
MPVTSVSHTDNLEANQDMPMISELRRTKKRKDISLKQYFTIILYSINYINIYDFNSRSSYVFVYKSELLNAAFNF